MSSNFSFFLSFSFNYFFYTLINLNNFSVYSEFFMLSFSQSKRSVWAKPVRGVCGFSQWQFQWGVQLPFPFTLCPLAGAHHHMALLLPPDGRNQQCRTDFGKRWQISVIHLPQFKVISHELSIRRALAASRKCLHFCRCSYVSLWFRSPQYYINTGR